MPWWLIAIPFFFLGMLVERFLIDRKFVASINDQLTELSRLLAERDKET